MSAKSRMFWYVRPMPSSATSFGASPTMFTPSKMMLPEVGW